MGQLADVLEYKHITAVEKDIAQTPFVKAQTYAQGFGHEMWIASVKTSEGNIEQQLQYVKRVSLTFQARQECLECEGVTEVTSFGCQAKCAGMEVPFRPPPSERSAPPQRELRSRSSSTAQPIIDAEVAQHLFEHGVSSAEKP